MNCYLSAVFGLGLLGASIMTMSSSKKECEKLKSILSSEQVEKYEKIRKQRRNQFLQGIILGLVLSFVIVQMSHLNTFTKIALFLTVTLTTSVVYYSLMPKYDYMLNYLTTKEEVDVWLDVYKNMKKRYIIGFLLGVLSSIPISIMFC